MKDLRIAAVCMKSPPGEIDKNLDRIKTFAQRAADRKVDIICFPELSITGYILTDPGNIYSNSISKEIIDSVEKMARSMNLVIMAGMIEKTDSKRPYLSHVVAKPDGLLGIYRKTHLSPQEKDAYRSGQDLSTYSTNGVVFGVQLCYEAHFPEISTRMVLDGAEIIFIPHASPRGTPAEKTKSWLRHLPARAFDNSVFIVACNQVGTYNGGLSFPGVSIAFDPLGQVIDQYAGDKEEMLIIDLKKEDLDKTRNHRMKYFIPHRRPELYNN